MPAVSQVISAFYLAISVLFFLPVEARAQEEFGIERVTYDLGASTGTFGNRTYTEANLGLNLYFSEYFAWRNAIFGRFISGLDDIYGLDSSGRVIFSTTGPVGITAFGGPGYRFATGGESVPFAEAGLVLRGGGLAIGGGVKALLNSWVRSGMEDDTQFFLILAGGGTL